MKTEEALNQIAYLQELITETRLRAADGYRYFLLWGALWTLSYLSSIWLSYLFWAVIGSIGGILTAVLWSTQKKRRSSPPLLKKLGWLGLILFLYASCIFTLLIMFSHNIQLFNSFWPFHIGLIYLAAGVFVGREIVLIGGWLIMVAVAGLWMPALFQALWLAAGGGGGLFFTGLILKKRVVKDE